jgi:hypothetical protein
VTQCSNDFESGSDTTVISGANSASPTALDSVINSPVFSATQKAHGSLSARFQTIGAGTQYMAWSTAGGTMTDHYGRCYVYLDIGALTNIAQVRFLEFRNASGLTCFIRPKTSGTARVTEIADSGGGVAATGTTVWTKNQWVRIEWHIVHSATVGTIDVRVYNSADSTTIDETVSASALNLGTDNNNLRIGVTTSVANFPGGTGTWCYLDDIVYGATSWPGPAGGVVQFPAPPIRIPSPLVPVLDSYTL